MPNPSIDWHWGQCMAFVVQSVSVSISRRFAMVYRRWTSFSWSRKKIRIHLHGCFSCATYVFFSELLRTFFGLLLSTAFPVEAMRQKTKCFFFVHTSAIVIDVFQFDVRSIMILFLEVSQRSRGETITASVLIVDFTKEKTHVVCSKTWFILRRDTKIVSRKKSQLRCFCPF